METIEITMVVKATYRVDDGEYAYAPLAIQDAAFLLRSAIKAAVDDGTMTSDTGLDLTHLTAEAFAIYNSPYSANVSIGDVYEYNPDGAGEE